MTGLSQRKKEIATNELRFVYDGWNLSGTLEGAGGIGGLLDHSTFNFQPSTAYYHADGNGNVTCLVDEQNTVVARYIYDPYGNITASQGSLADANLYRFSSKEFHPQSELVYYLYRYYEPDLQRWANRDPIQENGGLNLHPVLLNDCLNYFDLFGLTSRGRPPVFNPKDWNPGRDNCLAYALNRPGGQKYLNNNNGRGDATECKGPNGLLAQIKNNYQGTDSDKSTPCPTGNDKIKVYDPADGGSGFHAQRQDADGTWSELEYNGGPPKQCKMNWGGLGNNPTDPNGGKACGFLCVPD